jgi:hypothetical protein
MARRGNTPSASALATAPANGLADRRVRLGLIIVALLLAGIVVIGADYAFSTIFGNGSGAAPSATLTQKNP